MSVGNLYGTLTVQTHTIRWKPYLCQFTSFTGGDNKTANINAKKLLSLKHDITTVIQTGDSRGAWVLCYGRRRCCCKKAVRLSVFYAVLCIKILQ